MLGAGGAAAQSGSGEIGVLRQEIERLQRRLDELEAGARPASGAATGGSAAQQAKIQTLEKKVDQLERTQQQAAAQVVTGGDFPGSFRLPGTDLSVKIGGYVKADLIHDFDDIGSEDLFVTSTINTGGNKRQGRTRLHARQSRLNIDARRPSEYGPVRAFIEGDFFGSSGNQNVSNSSDFRLRHAYGEIGGLIAGQTWSTFMDVSVIPDTLDFEGPNSELFIRQAQFRWTQPLSEDLSLALAVENPEGDISGPDGDLNLDGYPDGVVRLRWDQDWGHLQTAFLARELRVDDGEKGDGEFGYGLTLSGSLKVPQLHPKDLVAFQVNYGDGIGRYITDLGGAGLDAVQDDDGNLDTVEAFGVMVQGQHWWNDRWRSTLAYGYLTAEPSGNAPETALNESHYLATNLIWSPIPSVDIGGEYLWGYLETEEDRSGAANRLQASVTYRF